MRRAIAISPGLAYNGRLTDFNIVALGADGVASTRSHRRSQFVQYLKGSLVTASAEYAEVNRLRQKYGYQGQFDAYRALTKEIIEAAEA